MGVVHELGDNQQFGVTEAMAIAPLIPLLEGADDGDALEHAFGTVVLPDRCLDPAVTKRCNRNIAIGLAHRVISNKGLSWELADPLVMGRPARRT